MIVTCKKDAFLMSIDAKAFCGQFSSDCSSYLPKIGGFLTIPVLCGVLHL